MALIYRYLETRRRARVRRQIGYAVTDLGTVGGDVVAVDQDRFFHKRRALGDIVGKINIVDVDTAFVGKGYRVRQRFALDRVRLIDAFHDGESCRQHVDRDRIRIFGKRHFASDRVVYGVLEFRSVDDGRFRHRGLDLQIVFDGKRFARI